MNLASPLMAMIVFPGKVILADIAPGKATPIDAKPFEIMQLLGASA